ncbi:MAG: methylamine utilization protein MauE [Sphingomonadaceae bacterium]|nr:methylamine utilization protein MauE [Sphingomonadaceae bacterium]
MAVLALAVAGRAAAIGVGLIFLIAGIDQWRHRILLPGVIANYRLLPRTMIAPAATLLPALEILLGGALIAGLAPLSLVAAIALLLVFAGAMAINIRRGRTHIDCGCGHGALRHPIGWPPVIRNLALAALLLPGLLPAPALSAMDSASALGAGLAIALLVHLFQSLGALAASPVHRR